MRVSQGEREEEAKKEGMKKVSWKKKKKETGEANRTKEEKNIEEQGKCKIKQKIGKEARWKKNKRRLIRSC